MIYEKIEQYHKNGSLSDKEYLELLIKVNNAERQARFFDNLEAKLEPLDMGKLDFDFVYIGDKLYDIANSIEDIRKSL